MRWLRRLLVIASLAILTVIIFAPKSVKQPPLLTRHLVEAPSPLAISVHCPTDADQFIPPSGWQSASDPHPKLIVLVSIKNISTRAIVLPAFTYWHPGIDFSSSSVFARRPKFFLAPTGQIDWVLLKPNDTITAYDDVANYLTFLVSGSYTLKYIFGVDYYYPDNSSASLKEIIQSHRPADFSAQAHGDLTVSVTPDQVSSR